MKYKYIMWDWNGTILDDLEINFETINTLLSKRGLQKMTDISQYLDAFGFPIIGFYEKMGFDLENEKFQDIARDYVREYYYRFPECEIFPNAEKVIRELYFSGVQQLIVSATEQESLIKQVEEFGIDHLFSDILGRSDIFAGSKVDIGLLWVKENKADPKEILFVGDTIHDFETAQNIGCDCVLVATGHNAKERLQLTGCTVISELSEILEMVK